jgi:hypothetical protein
MKPTAIPPITRTALSSILSPQSKTPSVSLPVQSTSHVLMVRPSHFCRNEESASDNSFMIEAHSASSELRDNAIKEFDGFVRALRTAGAQVLQRECSFIHQFSVICLFLSFCIYCLMLFFFYFFINFDSCTHMLVCLIARLKFLKL